MNAIEFKLTENNWNNIYKRMFMKNEILKYYNTNNLK